MNRLCACLALIVVVAFAAMLQAQVFRGRRGMPIYQNEPPGTDFVIARWKYSNNGRIDGVGWSHDYPQAEEHISGTFWGDIDLANRPLKPSIESLRLGIDFALFALTH